VCEGEGRGDVRRRQQKRDFDYICCCGVVGAVCMMWLTQGELQREIERERQEEREENHYFLLLLFRRYLPPPPPPPPPSRTKEYCMANTG
jgi:hypothetical protein